MSVEIGKAPSWRTCNSCAADKDVIEITATMHLYNGKQGLQLSLCKKCAIDLFVQLRPFVSDNNKEWLCLYETVNGEFPSNSFCDPYPGCTGCAYAR